MLTIKGKLPEAFSFTSSEKNLILVLSKLLNTQVIDWSKTMHYIPKYYTMPAY